MPGPAIDYRNLKQEKAGHEESRFRSPPSDDSSAGFWWTWLVEEVDAAVEAVERDSNFGSRLET
eukprot:387954-Rhodomonas_salina.2